jgi:YD repeat-containing protein
VGSYPATTGKVKGLAASQTRGGRTTTYTDDDFGRVLTEADTQGRTTTNVYSDSGHT